MKTVWLLLFAILMTALSFSQSTEVTISGSQTKRFTSKMVSGGLTTNDGEPLSELAIAGEDKHFIWAKTKIEGNKIVVWNDDIKEPKYVRYAWADMPVNPKFINKEGLPAVPFRTDQ